MNHIALDGRLTKQPELKTSNNGIEFVKFTVANDRRQSKEKKTDFIDCVVYGQSAAFLNKYFNKGDGIIVEGRLESDKYTNKEGKSVTNWSVHVEQIGFPVGGRKAEKTDSEQTELTDINTDDIPF